MYIHELIVATVQFPTDTNIQILYVTYIFPCPLTSCYKSFFAELSNRPFTILSTTKLIILLLSFTFLSLM